MSQSNVDVDPKLIPYYLGFSYMQGIGPMKFKALLETYKDIEKAYHENQKNLTSVLGEKLAKEFVLFREKFKADSIVSELYKKNIQIIAFGTKEYPQLLSYITDPPICLYARGNSALFVSYSDRFLAIVGTRRPTSYGAHVVQELVSPLVNAGFAIVSGLARGVDGLAHRETIACGGKTVAVLGCGVDVVYPPENTQLYENIIASDGLIISEFPPGSHTLKGFFVTRNRIVSGISRGVCVIEGSEHSGTLITARYAAEQGRDVFASPGQITSSYSRAPNLLIKQGAKIALSADDILSEYNIISSHLHKTSNNLQPIIHNQQSLSDIERQIVSHLQVPLDTDDLSRKLHISISELLPILSKLELLGILHKQDEGTWECC